jgi:hypothetical protein
MMNIARNFISAETADLFSRREETATASLTQLSGAAKSVSEASRQLADETGRSAEAIRKHIQRGDGTGQLSSLSGTDKHPNNPQAKQKRYGDVLYGLCLW